MTTVMSFFVLSISVTRRLQIDEALEPPACNAFYLMKHYFGSTLHSVQPGC